MVIVSGADWASTQAEASLHLLAWNHNEEPLVPGPRRVYPSLNLGRNNFPLILRERLAVIAAPVLVCLAGAVLARRLLPMLARRVAAVQRRRTGLVGLLGAARTRDDRVSPAAVVSLVAALGAATFAGCAVATLDAGRAATAAEAAGADLRVSGSSLDPERVAELSRLADVGASVTLTDGSDVIVRSGSATAYATRVLTDALALEDVQRDVPGAVPGVDRLAASIDGRVPVVVSQALADSLEGERDVTVDRVRSRVVAVGPARLAGVPDRLWVLADRDALGDERPEYDPVLSVLSSTTGAPPALARRAEGLFPDDTVTTPAREQSALEENPVVTGVNTVAGVAAAVAALLVGVTVVLALVAGAASRTRDLAVVRALGLTARRARVLPLWEVGLLVVVAGAVGAVVGIVLPLTVLGAIDLGPFTGDARPPTTFPALWWALVAVGVLLVTVAGALLSAGGAARRELTSSLRMMGE